MSLFKLRVSLALLGLASLTTSALAHQQTQPAPPMPPPPDGAGVTSVPQAGVLDLTSDCGRFGPRHMRIAWTARGGAPARIQVRELDGTEPPPDRASLDRLDRGLARLDAVLGANILCVPEGGNILVRGSLNGRPEQLSFSWLRAEVYQHDERGNLIRD